MHYCQHCGTSWHTGHRCEAMTTPTQRSELRKQIAILIAGGFNERRHYTGSMTPSDDMPWGRAEAILALPQLAALNDLIAKDARIEALEAEIAARDEAIVAAREMADALKALGEEYERDEECDEMSINRLIENGTRALAAYTAAIQTMEKAK